MRSRLILAGLTLCVSLLFAHTGQANDEAVFPLDEVSVFDSGEIGQVVNELTYGARATTKDAPFEEVKAYPKLLSEKPIYGVLRLGSQPYDKESGTPLYFVVDERSDEGAEQASKSDEPEAAEEPSLLERIAAGLLGKKDDSPAEPVVTPKLDNTYNRLYVDLNGDLDLTNDGVVKPMKSPPPEAVQRYSGIRQCVVFDEIAVPVDFGAELGSRPVRLVPRVSVQEYQEQQYRGASFISAVVRVGSIKLGDRRYKAVLAQRYLIGGRYDAPYTALLLTLEDDPNWREYWWGADQLNAMRLVGGQYYVTTTTPLGDKLTVSPYEGDFGVFRIGPGKRELDKVTIQGSLHSKDAAIALGSPDKGSPGTLTPVTECRLPVGDYMPNFVTIEYGHLRLQISENYHADGKPQAIDAKSWSYAIKIRKDEPFVWDFSTPPEVMFASPAKDQTYQPGEEISVKAVLVDPKLTVMIRGLDDVDRKKTETLELGDNQTTTIERPASLDPVVTITDSSGKQLAEGPMPFG